MYLILLIGVIAFLPSSGWAAMCATIDVQNTLIVNTTPIGECAGLVVLSIEDWPGASVWALPTNEQIALVWFAGFSIPITLFLISWSLGAILSMLRR